jgi:HK97 family phage major capsid protein/HK97 family phage prohead protease
MNRAHATFQIRAVDDEQRVIEGIASTDALDDYDTILEPKGAQYTTPLPLLWQHRGDSPVGQVLELETTAKRITFRARIAKILEPGILKDEPDRAWQAVKHGLVPGVSVGFVPIETAGGTSQSDPIRFVKWVLRELSLVTLPANTEATITAIRSADLATLATSGNGTPGSSGIGPSNTRRKMTIQEQITQHENSRAAKVARRTALMETSGAEGRTLAANEAEEYDTLEQDVRTIDEHLVRLRALVRDNEAAATPVNGTSVRTAAESRNGLSTGNTTDTRGVPIVRVQSRDGAGFGFGRYVQSLVAANGNRNEAAENARATWPGEQGENVALMHRAAVAAGTTTNATFAAPLVHTNYVNEFLELLRPATLLGKIQNLKKVPFYTQMTVQTAGGTYSWVGQGVAKPVTNLQVAAVSLGIAKAAGIIVISEELARNSTPSATGVVTDEMRDGMQQYLDTQFVDPAVAAVSNVSPASITNGVTGTAASGTTEAAARADLRALIGAYATANLGLGGLVLLMGETIAFKLGTMVNAVGGPAFPGLTINGGNILGIPVVTSNVTPLLTRIVAVHAPSVMLADEGGTEISISREASIIMDSAPSAVVQSTPGAAPTFTSMWQNNLVGIRAERWINWGKARSTAVDMIHTVAYA